jgi:hypothetical protein
MAKQNLTAESLREQFDYDPESGQLTRKPCQRSKWLPLVVTSRDTCGYLRASVNGSVYSAHRLVWLFHYGAWPQGEIDHINGDRADNRIANLRDVTRPVNMQNLRVPVPSKVAPGVYHSPGRSKPYRARISVNGRKIDLGYYDSQEAASAAYSEAKHRFHPGCS